MSDKLFSFYDAYSKEKRAIDSAIIKSVYDSASNMPKEMLKKLFSIRTFGRAK